MGHARQAFDVLGDPTRRAIFEALIQEPMAVGVLAERFPISRPGVSKHLRLLKDADLIEAHPDGSRRIYRARPEGVAALRDYLDELWRLASARFVVTAQSLTGPALAAPSRTAPGSTAPSRTVPGSTAHPADEGDQR